jgi:hypothetical protein
MLTSRLSLPVDYSCALENDEDLSRKRMNG